MYTIDELVQQAKDKGSSDIHLICGLPPKYRVDGQLESMQIRLLRSGTAMSYASPWRENILMIIRRSVNWIFPESFVTTGAGVMYSGSRVNCRRPFVF